MGRAASVDRREQAPFAGAEHTLVGNLDTDLHDRLIAIAYPTGFLEDRPLHLVGVATEDLVVFLGATITARGLSPRYCYMMTRSECAGRVAGMPTIQAFLQRKNRPAHVGVLTALDDDTVRVGYVCVVPFSRGGDA